MKAKKLLALACLLIPAMGMQAQEKKAEIIIADIPWAVQGTSPNGRYICGTRQYEEAYIFDTKTKELKIVKVNSSKSHMNIMDVTDDGVGVGRNDNGLPGVFEDGVWSDLPTPGAPHGDASFVYGVNSNGTKLVGQVSVKPGADQPFKVKPVVWTKRADGFYVYDELPVPEKDFVGAGAPQFVSPRQMSEDGKTVAALIIDNKGKYHQQIIYRQQEDGSWKYSMPFVAMFCRMEKYDEIFSKEPKMKEIVTAKPGTKEYFAQVDEFQKALAKWDWRVKQEWLTGYNFTAVPVIMSENGKYIASAYAKTTFSYTEGDLSVKKESSSYHPALYDVEKGELIEFPKLTGYAPFGVTNAGDMISTVGNTKFFVIELKNKDKVNTLEDWLKEHYALNLFDTLPKNTTSMSGPATNGKGNLIAGKYVSAAEDNRLDKQEIFCIRLYDRDGEEDRSVESVSDATMVAVFPNPTTDVAQVVGARAGALVRVLTLGGEMLMQTQADASGVAQVDMSQLENAFYLVQLDGSKTFLVQKR